jgi:Putative beta-barrel porin 2
MPRLSSTAFLVRICQNLWTSQGTVGICVSTVLLLFVTAHLYIQDAEAEVVISSGLSGGEKASPFAALRVENIWSLGGWNFSALGEGRFEYDDGLDDANAKVEWHADTGLSPKTELEIDSAYAFERERIEAIKQFHRGGADIGLEHPFDAVTLKADVGFETQIFEDTTEKGFSPLDRSRENLVDTEAALRLTFLPGSTYRPFVETAYVVRAYFKEPDRGYAGPEFIGGVTFSLPRLSGDLGVMFALRNENRGTHRHLFGPYADLKWQVLPETEISLGLGAGLDQDTSGEAELFPRYSGRLEVSQRLPRDLNLSFSFDALQENRSVAREREFSPSVTLAWSPKNGPGVYGSLGMTHSTVQGEPATTTPDFEVGVKWVW